MAGTPPGEAAAQRRGAWGSDLPCPWHEKPMSFAEPVRLVRSFTAASLDARPRDRPRPAGA